MLVDYHVSCKHVGSWNVGCYHLAYWVLNLFSMLLAVAKVLAVRMFAVGFGCVTVFSASVLREIYRIFLELRLFFPFQDLLIFYRFQGN